MKEGQSVGEDFRERIQMLQVVVSPPPVSSVKPILLFLVLNGAVRSTGVLK